MSQFVATDENLCVALRKRVQTFKEENPSLSSQQIAKSFNMSSSTLNRIENEDIKKPTFDQVLKILKGTGQTGDLLSYLEESYPSITETFREVYAGKTKVEYVPTVIEDYFVNPKYFKLMSLVFSGCSVSRDLISKIFGSEGLSCLDNLITDKVFHSCKDGLVEGKKDSFRLSLNGTRKLLSLVVDQCFKTENATNYTNHLTFQASSVNKELVMPEILKVLEDTHAKINNIFKRNEDTGNDCVYVGIVSDTIL